MLTDEIIDAAMAAHATSTGTSRERMRAALAVRPRYSAEPLIADCRGGRFILRLVPMEEGERLAREAGGLPV